MRIASVKQNVANQRAVQEVRTKTRTQLNANKSLYFITVRQESRSSGNVVIGDRRTQR